jgi:CPA1 family monovalent cation:H+ antiporter
VTRHSSTIFSPGVRLQAVAVWEALEFLLNGLVFVMIGLQLPYVLGGLERQSKVTLVLYALGFSAILIVLRLAWMYPAARAAWWVRTKLLRQAYEKPASNQVFVVGWTGMRGVVALAAANALPLTLNDGTPFPQRAFIIYLTFSVILVTLVLQGLSLPWLVRVLGLTTRDTSFCEEGQARHLLLQAALEFLKERRHSAQGESEIHLYDDFVHTYEHKMAEIDLCGPGGAVPDENAGSLTSGRLLLETIRREREELNLLRASGRIGDGVHRTLERELDLTESRLS